MKQTIMEIIFWIIMGFIVFNSCQKWVQLEKVEQRVERLERAQIFK